MTDYSVNNDTELVLQLKQDQVKAFDAIYWRYHSAVFLNIQKLVKDADAARDILQEVFIVLWESRASIKTDRPVANWLFVVSYNKSVSYLKRTSKLALFTSIDDVPVEEYLPLEENTNLREAQLQLIEEAMAELSIQKRRVFRLCKLEGKTYEEAALELGISKHTVKEYLSGAVLHVKEFIKHHPHYAVLGLPISLFSLFIS